MKYRFVKIVFVLQRKWKLLDGGSYCFNRCNDKEDEFIPADRLLKDSIGYARELEIIV